MHLGEMTVLEFECFCAGSDQTSDMMSVCIHAPVAASATKASVAVKQTKMAVASFKSCAMPTFKVWIRGFFGTCFEGLPTTCLSRTRQFWVLFWKLDYFLEFN